MRLGMRGAEAFGVAVKASSNFLQAGRKARQTYDCPRLAEVCHREVWMPEG